MAYKGHHGKIYFNIAVNAFQIPLMTFFEKTNGSHFISKLHLLSRLNEIFMVTVNHETGFSSLTAIWRLM